MKKSKAPKQKKARNFIAMHAIARGKQVHMSKKTYDRKKNKKVRF